MMCEFCEKGEHSLCGMQTWCECECDGSPEWGNTQDYDYPHTLACTCESCLQNHPERDIIYGDGDYFDWGETEDDEAVEQSVQLTDGGHAESDNESTSATIGN